MSFVGLVTRKEKDTGVSLMAKIVTPNKKKSTKKIIKVKVKANALDDYACCVIDHATAINKIDSSQDMNQLIDDVNLMYNGENGTTISYRIIDVNAPLLSQYLGEDGKIIQRPKYGEGDAVGYIEVTVSKNGESVTSRVVAAVKSIAAEEVLSDNMFSQASLWASIRGANDTYQQGNEWSGHNNIAHTLTLIKSKSVNTSKTPVTITWEVKDDTLAYASAKNVYSEPRIDVTDGTVSRCDYKSACTLIGSVPGVTVKVIGSDNSSWQNRVRIGGLTLTAKLTLGEASKDVVFNCSTVSKYLTNQEVMDAVLNNLCLFTPDSAPVRYKEQADSSYETIIAPADGGTYTLKAYGNRGSELFQAPDLNLNIGDIVGVAITNEVREFNGSANYPDTGLLTTAFNNGFQNDEGESYMKLVIDFNEIKDASSELKKFACSAKITVSGYSANGLSAGGSSLNISRYAQFIIDTTAMA